MSQSELRVRAVVMLLISITSWAMLIGQALGTDRAVPVEGRSALARTGAAGPGR